MSNIVSDRILNLAVDRVKRNCLIALETRKHIDRDGAMELLHPVNAACMESAIESAQLVLDAEPKGKVSPCNW